MKNKLYLITTLTRSYNEGQIKNKNALHLIASIFYTSTLNNITLSKIHKYLDKTILFFISLNKDSNLVIHEDPNNNNLVIIKMDIFYFLSSYSNLDLKTQSSEHYEDFISIILGNCDQGSKIPFIEDKTMNVFFIFEDISWYGLQTIFKTQNIILSSGSTTRRHLLSTSDFKLSLLLYSLGFTSQDIYESSVKLEKMLKSKEKSDFNIFNTLSCASMLSIINAELASQKEIYTNLLTAKEDQLKSNIKSCSSSNAELTVKTNAAKGNINKLTSMSPRIKSLTKKVETFNKIIEALELEVKELKTNLLAVTEKSENLENLTYIQIKELYLKEYHNSRYSKDTLKLRKYSNKIIVKSNTNEEFKVINLNNCY